LQVHQIELEMQNEELRRAQEELEASRARYFDLYDLAPVGYFTLSEQGLILEANLTGAGLLGLGRRDLTSSRSPATSSPKTRTSTTGTADSSWKRAPQECELRMLRADAAPFWARLESTVAQDGESGDSVCRVVVSDIEREHAYACLEVADAGRGSRTRISKRSSTRFSPASLSAGAWVCQSFLELCGRTPGPSRWRQNQAGGAPSESSFRCWSKKCKDHSDQGGATPEADGAEPFFWSKTNPKCANWAKQVLRSLGFAVLLAEGRRRGCRGVPAAQR
jgi:hypothetical protein